MSIAGELAEAQYAVYEKRIAEMNREITHLIEVMSEDSQRSRLLVAKAKALVDMLDDAERNHGGMVGRKTLTCANELRLELSRWSR